MKTIELKDATGALAEYAAHVADGPVVITVDGKPYAALVSVQDADLECACLASDPKFASLLERSRARLRAEGGISGEEMRRRFGSGE